MRRGDLIRIRSKRGPSSVVGVLLEIRFKNFKSEGFFSLLFDLFKQTLQDIKIVKEMRGLIDLFLSRNWAFEYMKEEDSLCTLHLLSFQGKICIIDIFDFRDVEVINATW